MGVVILIVTVIIWLNLSNLLFIFGKSPISGNKTPDAKQRPSIIYTGANVDVVLRREAHDASGVMNDGRMKKDRRSLLNPLNAFLMGVM